MTYIELINGFENWLETHHLPIASQLLWYKLIALFNRCGWQEWINVRYANKERSYFYRNKK